MVDVEGRLRMLQEQGQEQAGPRPADVNAVVSLESAMELNAQAILGALPAQIVDDEVLNRLFLLPR